MYMYNINTQVKIFKEIWILELIHRTASEIITTNVISLFFLFTRNADHNYISVKYHCRKRLRVVNYVTYYVFNQNLV